MVDSTGEQAPIVEAIPPNGDGDHCQPKHTVFVAVNAAPDLDPTRPGAQVVAVTVVQLTGSCNEMIVTSDCEVTLNPLPFTWSLTFQPPAGSQTDITASLVDASTLTPHFTASNEGTYRATLRGGNTSLGMRTASVEIDAAPPPPVLLQRTGIITFLRVHDLGTGFGPPTDFVDVEAVIKLDSVPTDAFGFQLRNDRNRPSRQGMLDLLRDAFFGGHAVTIDYFIIPGRHNGRIIRVALAS